MDVVRDLLDKSVVDRNGREVGRVDRVVLALDGDRQPRVAALEVGPSALAARLHPMLGAWIRGLELALGIDRGRPMRVPIDDVLAVADHVKIDAAVGETPASALERRLRRWVRAVPGGG
jgi:sporulation protein YlmC with PRC-barrel domain